MNHHRSALKVGVDGVLVGAWCDFPDNGDILDVGTGCGLIALMAAQRTNTSNIQAIDIDFDSVEEAKDNFKNSAWAPRLNCSLLEFDAIVSSSRRFDYIVSNPPFFTSGIANPDTPRLTARHATTLSPVSFVEGASLLLNPDGKTGLIAPFDSSEEIISTASASGLSLVRKACIKGHSNAPVKRVLLEFTSGRTDFEASTETIILEASPGCPTDSYRELCRDFYLKF